MTDIEDEDEDLGAQMSFGDHLEELRSRLLKALGFSVASFILIFTFFNREVMRFVVAPFTRVAAELRIDGALNMLGPTQGFFAYLTVSLIVALLVSAPFWMWQFWQFIGAGLYKHERVWVYRFAPLMIGLFIGGVSFGYSLLIPIGLEYLLSFPDPEVVQSWIGLSEYLSLFTTLTLVLGLTFQLPVGMALFAKLDLVGVATFREKRRYFILIAFIVGALLTPPDAVTQTLMALPLILLYELGVLLAWLAEGARRSAVNWRLWRRRGVIALTILVVLFLFQDKLRSSYRARLVGLGVRTAAKPIEETVPYFEIFGEVESLGYAPRLAYRVEGDETRELWVVGDDDRADPVIVRFEDSRLGKISDVKDGPARFMLRAGSQIIEVQVPREMDGRVLGDLLTALNDAGADDGAVLERLAAGLVGARPAGAVRMDSDDTAQATIDAWQKWWREHRGSWRFVRGD